MRTSQRVRSLRLWRPSRWRAWTCCDCGALVPDEAVGVHAHWHFPPTAANEIPRAVPTSPLLEGGQHRVVHVDEHGAILS